MLWAEQRFAVTPEYVGEEDRAQVLAERPLGQCFSATSRMPPEYTFMSRIEMGAASVIAQLRAGNHWGAIAAEHLENAAPLTEMGKREHAFFEERAGGRPCLTGQPGRSRPRIPTPPTTPRAQRAPVQWNEQLGAYLVLSYEHAAAVLRGPEWSSDPRNSPRLLASLGGPGPVAEVWSRSLLMSDPPAHTRLRTAVNRFFTPHAVRRIRERVASIVEAAFAPLAEGGPIELMSELAYPIPLAVIAELFDVGIEGRNCSAQRPRRLRGCSSSTQRPQSSRRSARRR